MRVYISSTYKDLINYRKAAMDAILQFDYTPIGMEHDVASEKRPLDVCLERLGSCQVYVGIIAWRYGYIHPKHDLSITELEYREAERLNISRLIFIVDENINWPPKWVEKGQSKFTQFRKNVSQGYIRPFTNEESLQKELMAALNEVERKHNKQRINQANNPKPPEFLPYLTDRDAQEHQLAKSLKSGQPAKPCVFIIHGDEYQCHDKFLERLRSVSLPKMVDLFCHSRSTDLTINPYTISWIEKTKEQNTFADRYHAGISKKVFGKIDTTPEEINRILSANSTVTIFDTHILSEDCLQNSKLPIDLFLNFWSEWPTLNTNQHLIIFLFIKYELKEKSSFLIRHKYKQLNNKIRRDLNSLSISAYQLNGAVLPELGNISRRHCEEWMRDDTVRQYLKNGETKIREFFEQWENRHHKTEIPMEIIAPVLWQWLIDQWQTQK